MDTFAPARIRLSTLRQATSPPPTTKTGLSLRFMNSENIAFLSLGKHYKLLHKILSKM